MKDLCLGIVLILCFTSRTKGQCRYMADIVIAVPGSVDVPQFEFDAFEQALTDLVSHFDIDQQAINIGLVLYGKGQIRVAAPQPYKTRKEINTRISLLHRRSQYSHGLNLESYVPGAIYAVHNMLLNPPTGYPREITRPNSRKIGVIFTYGTGDPSRQNEIQLDVEAAAAAAHRDGIMLYALSANGSVPGFQTIGNDYCRLFSMGSFNDSLPVAVPDLASGICSELDPTVQVIQNDCFPKRYGKENPILVSCIGDSVIVGDPNNCAYYFRCEFRQPVRYECAFDTLYDPHAKTCNDANVVECYSDVTCPRPHGLFPHPLDCSKFINCFHSIPYVQACALGSLFDDVNGTCNETGLVNCPPHKRIGSAVP